MGVTNLPRVVTQFWPSCGQFIRGCPLVCMESLEMQGIWQLSVNVIKFAKKITECMQEICQTKLFTVYFKFGVPLFSRLWRTTFVARFRICCLLNSCERFCANICSVLMPVTTAIVRLMVVTSYLTFRRQLKTFLFKASFNVWDEWLMRHTDCHAECDLVFSFFCTVPRNIVSWRCHFNLCIYNNNK